MSRTNRLSDLDERAVAAAEADLTRLLSIEPSPEFVAKVRARIDESREVKERKFGWLALSLASAAAVTVAIAIQIAPAVREGVAPPSGTRRADVALKIPPAAGEIPPVEHPKMAVAAGRHRETIASFPKEPEVLVDPSLAAAIRRLALGTRNTTLDESASTKPEGAVADSAASVVVEPLAVPELVLKPADPAGGQ